MRKAIITAGGLNSRFLPVTKAQPKAMLPLVDKPAIQYVVEEAAAAGIEEITIVTGPGKRVIMDHFDRAPELEDALRAADKKDQLEALEHLNRLVDSIDLNFIQQPRPLGLGHAVWMAHRVAHGEACAVLLCDDVMLGEVPCIKQLIEVHDRVGGTVLAVRKVAAEQLGRLGVITPGAQRGKVHEVTDMVEKPAPGTEPSDLAIFGRYVLAPEVFEELARTKAGAGGEIQLTDGIRQSIGRAPVVAVEFEGDYYDLGTVPGYLRANLTLAARRADLRTALAPLASELAGGEKGKVGV